LTLTFEEEPEVPNYAPMQMFLDRLRAHQRRKSNFSPIRYLAVGEFGERYGRFHFHALVFNWMDLDPEETLTRLWRNGHCHVGEVSQASIRYTARYTLEFLGKDEQPHPRGRSQRPPLGEPVMTSLGQKARRNHPDGSLEIPTTIRWNGKTWPVDTAMQIAWMEGYDPSRIVKDAAGTRSLERSTVLAHSRYQETLKLGDPYADWRESRERTWLKKHREFENRVKL
jgi:hypothetical protein